MTEVTLTTEEEHMAERMGLFIGSAGPQQLISFLVMVSAHVGLAPDLRKQLVKTLALRLAVKVMEEDNA